MREEERRNTIEGKRSAERRGRMEEGEREKTELRGRGRGKRIEGKGKKEVRAKYFASANFFDFFLSSLRP